MQTLPIEMQVKRQTLPIKMQGMATAHKNAGIDAHENAGEWKFIAYKKVVTVMHSNQISLFLLKKALAISSLDSLPLTKKKLLRK